MADRDRDRPFAFSGHHDWLARPSSSRTTKVSHRHREGAACGDPLARDLSGQSTLDCRVETYVSPRNDSFWHVTSP